MFAGSGGPQPPYLLDKNVIITDLHSERPQWILSAYGPGRHAPAQLFGGPVREQSFEEMRLLHYVATAEGNPQHAVCLLFKLSFITLMIKSRYKKRRLFSKLQTNRSRQFSAMLIGQ
jgi:hypothetical protein